MNGGPHRTLDEARDATADLFRRIVAAPKRAPVIIAGATVSIPGGVMLPEALLVLDVIAVRLGDEAVELVVGEIKTYPDRAGYTDPRELSIARAQAGVYIHGLELVLDQLGLTSSFLIQLQGFLVLSRPGFNQPSIRAREDLNDEAERARRGFELLRRAAGSVKPLPNPEEASCVAAVRNASTAFGETCLSFCDRALCCRKAALAAGNPAVLGDDMSRFLGAINLHRGIELLTGKAPVSDVERDLVRRLNDAERRAGSSDWSRCGSSPSSFCGGPTASERRDPSGTKVRGVALAQGRSHRFVRPHGRRIHAVGYCVWPPGQAA